MPGAPPTCTQPECPGCRTPDDGGWVKVWRRRRGPDGEDIGRNGGVGFKINRAQMSRSTRQGTMSIQTVSERIRRPVRGTEIDERPYHTGLPLATIRHVLMECDGTGGTQEKDGFQEVIGRAVKATDKISAAKEANRTFRKANAALHSAKYRPATASEWETIHSG